ncbi:hypothetical protein OUZ56_012367 [Daphnia magna]|uniref:Uncharacterized protein n=1 Tax=Daphnia magna TaxID=35525 RepID=A0ABQ9Z2T1_9CRUS|nr:hypothetical protein OUZ56_012367 [Daphnia magna]
MYLSVEVGVPTPYLLNVAYDYLLKKSTLDVNIASRRSNEYPGYARLRDILPLLHARFLWWAESGEDIYHPLVSVSNIYPELTYSEIQIRLEHRQVRLAVLNHLNDFAEDY